MARRSRRVGHRTRPLGRVALTVIGSFVRSALAATFLSYASLAAASQPSLAGRGVEGADLIDDLQLRGKLFHVQGVDFDTHRIWVTSVDRKHRRGFLSEFDRATGALLRRVDLTDGVRYHPGGIAAFGHSIWVPVAEYKPNSSAVLEEIDTDTLQVRRRILVADHLGCVAASASNLIAGNWDSKLLYVFDLGADNAVHIVPNPSRTRYQDMKLVDGDLIASGTLTRSRGEIDWIDWRSMTLSHSLRSGKTTPSTPSGNVSLYTRAGMTIAGHELYLVPLDGPSRMFHFRIQD